MFDWIKGVLRGRQEARSSDANLSAVEYERFTAIVADHLARLGRSCEIVDGVAIVANGRREPHRYGLANLARQCIKSDVDQWHDIVAGHFARSDQADEDAAALERSLTDFGAVESILCAQMAAQHAAPVDSLVWREDVPGLATYLVADLPVSTRSIRPEDAACWGQTRDALFDLALRNVWRCHKPKLAGLRFEGLGTCLLCDGDEMFTATFALMLSRHAQAAGAGGALVGIPTGSKVLSMPIHDLRIHRVAPMLEKLVRTTFDRDPRPVSPDLYWYQAGAFHKAEYRVAGRELAFEGPPGLLESLEALPPVHSSKSE